MSKFNYQDAVIEFLSQKENLPFALEVSDAIPEIKNCLLDNFWHALVKQIKAQVDESDDWIIKVDAHIPKKQNQGVYLYPKGHSMMAVMLGHEAMKLYLGAKKMNDSDLSLAHEFFSFLKNDGFKNNNSFGAWKYFQEINNSFFLKLSSNVDDTAEEIASIFWTFGCQSREELIKANIALASKQGDV